MRKEGDSNPRYGNPHGSLANCWFQPLTHPSSRFVSDRQASSLKCVCKGTIKFLSRQTFLKYFFNNTFMVLNTKYTRLIEDCHSSFPSTKRYNVKSSGNHFCFRSFFSVESSLSNHLYQSVSVETRIPIHKELRSTRKGPSSFQIQALLYRFNLLHALTV